MSTALDRAEAWRSFLGDAVREANIQIKRVELRVGSLPHGTPERRAASREARERNRLRRNLYEAYQMVTFRRLP